VKVFKSGISAEAKAVEAAAKNVRTRATIINLRIV